MRAKLSYNNEFFGVGFDLPFDGSMKLQCYKYNDEFYQIAVNLYDDPLCNNLITFDDEYGGDSTTTEDAMYIDMDNNKFTIYDSIQFSLDSMNCDLSSDDTDCGISFEMANNCSWSKSDRYLNISVPDSHCTSLAPDFGGILQLLPYEFLPPELVDNFQTSSMKYKCCSNDNSLLISNYSDTKCQNKPESQFRIPSKYNGQCFVINNNEDIVEDDTMRTRYNEDENSEDTYVYIMKWSCHSFDNNCSNIPILDDTFLPKTCSDECIIAEQEQEQNSNQGKSGGNRGNASSSKKNKILGVIGVIIAVIVLFVVVIVVSIVYGRKKAMQQQMERNLGNINNNNNYNKPGDDKYEAFVSNQDNDDEQNMNIVRVADINESNNIITNNIE